MVKMSVWAQGSGRVTQATIALALLATIIVILITNPFAIDIEKSVVTDSNVISIWVLVALRTIIAICSILTIVYVITKVKRDVLLYHTSSGNFEPVIMKGLWRLSTFTCWSFIGLSITFTILASCSWMEILKIEIPYFILQFAILIYPVVFANSLMVTLIVTFILIPGNQKRGHPLENWFTLPEQIMHNMNTIVLTSELVLGNLPIDTHCIALIPLLGIAYVIFAAFNEKKTGIYFYSFLDPRSNKAALIHLVLLIISIACFGIIFSVNIALKKWYVPTIILLLITIPFILYVREPEIENPQM